jgi:hypothetical protein
MRYSINEYVGIFYFHTDFLVLRTGPLKALPLSPADPAPRSMRWVWGLLLLWLVYSLGVMAWHVLNDPVLMASICRTR